MDDMIICPGCGWVGDVDSLQAGACPECGYENNVPPWRLLTITEMMYDDGDYNNVRMDLFLRAFVEVLGGGEHK